MVSGDVIVVYVRMLTADAVVVDDVVAENVGVLVVASDVVVLFSWPLDHMYIFKCSHHGPFLSYTYLL